MKQLAPKKNKGRSATSWLHNTPAGKKIFCDECERHGLPRPIPEYKFLEKRKFRIDFFFEAPSGVTVAFEVQGAVHRIRERYLSDIEKFNLLTLAGHKILLCTPKELFKKETFEMLKKAIGYEEK